MIVRTLDIPESRIEEADFLPRSDNACPNQRYFRSGSNTRSAVKEAKIRFHGQTIIIPQPGEWNPRYLALL